MPFERYKADIDNLVQRGAALALAMHFELIPEIKKKVSAEGLKKIPNFRNTYQSWYSEALVCISQLMPDRRDDFISYYKPLKARKSLDLENYTISDYLRGLSSSRLGEEIVGPTAALEPFQQQVRIVESLKQRFESSLFDIRALVQADLFDDELDAAQELSKKGFQRAAGAMSGVVLEGHLSTVCLQHQIRAPKNPTISKLNDLLKENNVIDQPTWRFIQHLGDLRNSCDHKRGSDPRSEAIEELIIGVKKITKTVF
jgi:hypothetical protein